MLSLYFNNNINSQLLVGKCLRLGGSREIYENNDSYYGDLSAIIDKPSPCGRTNIRIKGWMGRAEQSTKVKGIFVTPEQLNKVTNTFKEVIKVRLVIESKDFLDDPVLVCEVKGFNKINEEDIKIFFKSQFKLNIRVNFVETGGIVNDGKVIEDKRLKN